jgi:Flp pilus assembly protein TadG
MPLKLSVTTSNLRKARHALFGLHADQRGTVAVIMAFMLPILIGAFGLGFEITNWYLTTRSMQNAADAAAIAAATNGSANYNTEAAAVATQYGYTNGSNDVTLAASNAATCPADPSLTPPCYSVTITRVLPLVLTEVVGYLGNSTLNGGRAQNLTSTAVANKPIIQTPICLLGLDTGGTAIRTNGAPNTDFTGCTVMSNSTATCNGSNLKATMGLAHGTNNGCGITQYSTVPVVSDPYAYMASNIPNDLPTRCSNSYPQEPQKKNDPPLPSANQWSGSKTLTGTANLAGNTLICGDLKLTNNVTINAPSGAVLYIENGLLDLNGYTLSTASGSGVTIVFTGTNTGPSYQHYPTDNGHGGILDIEAPKTGPFSGMAIYQDPSLTRPGDVNFAYAGNDPTWNLTGGVYLPNADVTMSGAINKSTNGAVCMVMVTKDVTINGTGSIYAQTPDGSGCQAAGLTMPTATIPGRTKLVY